MFTIQRQEHEGNPAISVVVAYAGLVRRVTIEIVPERSRRASRADDRGPASQLWSVSAPSDEGGPMAEQDGYDIACE